MLQVFAKVLNLDPSLLLQVELLDVGFGLFGKTFQHFLELVHLHESPFLNNTHLVQILQGNL